MCPTICLSDSIGRLINHTGNSITGVGSDVFACLKHLTENHPAMKPYIFNESGDLTPFVNVYLNGIDIRTLEKKALQVSASDKIEIIPSLAGG